MYEDPSLFRWIPHHLLGIFIILGPQGAWGIHGQETEGCTRKSTQAEPWNSDAQGEDHRSGNKAHKASHTPGDPKGSADIIVCSCWLNLSKLVPWRRNRVEIL